MSTTYKQVFSSNSVEYKIKINVLPRDNRDYTVKTDKNMTAIVSTILQDLDIFFSTTF